ncbi:hydroxyisourate hydrolase [Alphaproteobacteria bacterium LSUCC0684]
MGRLTTHVLDTSLGVPAAGLQIVLQRRGGSDGQLIDIAKVMTNSDGRVDGPLLEGDALQAGRYRLIFSAGAYFRAQGIELPEYAFLDDVVIDFGISDPDQHYHVPLLLSPYGYSTYRGS